MFNKIHKSIACAIILSLASFTSFAADTGWYGGIAVGSGEINVSGIDSSSTFSIFAGNNINQNFAVEFGYTDLGEFDIPGWSNTYIAISGLEITAVGKMPVANGTDLFGKIGLYLWDGDAVLFGSTVATDSGSSVTFAFGADFAFTPTISGRIAFQHYGDVWDDDYTNLSFGIISHF